MKVYQDVDGKPVLVGECDLELPPYGRMPLRIAGPPRVQHPVDVACKGPMGTARMVRDEWEIGLVSEYGVRLRPTDDPEHLPGWKPLGYEAPKRSILEMAEKAARAFVLQVSHEPPSFVGRLKLVDYMAGVIEALMDAAARGEYRREPSPLEIIEEAFQGLGTPAAEIHGTFEGLETISAEAKAFMYRAAGLDPDGEPAGLPKRDEPEERLFVPNKFGEHD